VRRNGLHGARPGVICIQRTQPSFVSRRSGLGAAIQHQRGEHLEAGVQSLIIQGLGQGRAKPFLMLLVGEARVGGTQLHVGDQAVEQHRPALNDDERPLLHGQWVDRQPHAEGFFESPAGDKSNRRWRIRYPHRGRGR
jgi:hypothetical protein